jgi:hypothetical protein
VGGLFLLGLLIILVIHNELVPATKHHTMKATGGSGDKPHIF